VRQAHLKILMCLLASGSVPHHNGPLYKALHGRVLHKIRDHSRVGREQERRREERRGEERRREERRGEEEGGEERRREERSGEERRGEERTGEIKKQAVSWVESLQSFKGGSVKEFVALDFKSCFWTCMINRVRWHERGGLEKRKILEAKG
jgi:hypothetical protein